MTVKERHRKWRIANPEKIRRWNKIWNHSAAKQRANKRWRLAHRSQDQAIRRLWYQNRKAQLVAYKGGKCVDCGGTFPDCCMDFDHRDPSKKSFNIAAKHWSVSRLKNEVDKCDLVCSNCHRERTQKRLTSRN
jgi:hypothetical protein